MQHVEKRRRHDNNTRINPILFVTRNDRIVIVLHGYDKNMVAHRDCIS